MKRIIITLIISYTAATNAQINNDSLISKSVSILSGVVKDTITEDTINVRRLVEQQILAAKLKMQKESISNDSNNSYKLNVSEVPNFKPKKTLIQLFQNLSFEVKFLLIFSIFLFTLIAIRRIVLRIKIKEGIELRNKIKLLREERVPSRIEDKKSKSRRELIHDLPVKKLSEKNITKKAKELKISKGELMLAARLKYLEYEKI
ncbi:MAG: hypothetical protein QHH13_07690 [Melioribacter sp.]|uniref:hypothetical protein n=1 Tax=Rosettibacter primus TaxID=3111523 RepID=UPI00247E8C62|nr:hypothetical protein [Melioribacter sp.]